MKQCTICKELKPFSDFYKNKLTKNGVGSQCKICDSLEKFRVQREKKIKLINLLGGKCSRCGYEKSIAALDFHHIKDKNFNISEKLKYDISILVNEVKNCVILCSNCHREHHDEQNEVNRKLRCVKV